MARKIKSLDKFGGEENIQIEAMTTFSPKQERKAKIRISFVTKPLAENEW